MAPSLRGLRLAVTKKRKARGDGPAVDKRAVAKVPKRTDAEEARGGEPIRPRISRRVERAEAANAQAIGPMRESAEEIIAPAVGPALEEAEVAGPKEVKSDQGARESTPRPAPSEVLPPAKTDEAEPRPAPEVVPTEAEPVPAPEVAPAGATSPAAVHAEAPPPVGAQEAVESGESSQEIPPAVDPSFCSIITNYGRWAERILNESSVAEIQAYQRSRGRGTFFREASVAHLWALNSLIALRDVWHLGDAALDQAVEEMDVLRGRAERAEMAVEDVRSALKSRSDALRKKVAEVEYELEVAQRRAAHELENAEAAEELQKKAEARADAAESEVVNLREQLRLAVLETEAAKESARRSDSDVAVLKAEVAVAEERMADAERKSSEAARQATEAVEQFRKSEAFDTELAESTAFAYEAGFRDCKDKLQKLYDIEGIEDLEPDEVFDDDGQSPSDS